METIEIALAVIVAYLFGSLSSAIIVCKIARLPDPRTTGSNNPGATNVLRIGGKIPAAITLLGDVLKGFIPVLTMKWLGLSSTGLALVMLAAFIGHLFPVFFRFQGGKGVATLIGCLFALCWPVGLAWALTWFFVAMLFRYSSLAALVASLLTPLYMWQITDNMMYVDAVSVMVLMLIYRHRTNIMKLMAGQESRIKF